MIYKEKVQDIYNMFGQGKLMDVFEKYYVEGVIMEELMGKCIGKVVCCEYEEQFFNNVQEFYDLKVYSLILDEENGIMIVENMMEVIFKDGNCVQMEQVVVQKWEGDQIVYECFYYNVGQIFF